MAKIVYAALLLLLVLYLPMASAEDSMVAPRGPTLHLIPSSSEYEAGEHAFVVVTLENLFDADSVDIEIQLLAPGGGLAGGDVAEYSVPETDTPNAGSKETVSEIYRESVTYFGGSRAIYRLVEFDVPLDAATGEYTIAARAAAGNTELEDKVRVSVSGPGGFMDITFLVYIAILFVSVYLIRRE